MTFLLVGNLTFGGMRFCSTSSFVETVSSLRMGQGKGFVLTALILAERFWGRRTDATNMGRCRRSNFNLPMENVFFSSPQLPTFFSKSSKIALCGALRYSFQDSIEIQDYSTLLMLRPPKYNTLITSPLFGGAQRVSRSHLFSL